MSEVNELKDQFKVAQSILKQLEIEILPGDKARPAYDVFKIVQELLQRNEYIIANLEKEQTSAYNVQVNELNSNLRQIQRLYEDLGKQE